MNEFYLWCFLLLCLNIDETLSIRTDRCNALDMTHLLNKDAPFYPTYSRFNFSTGHAGPWGSVPYVEYNRIEMWEHTGTHVDAPAHFTKDGIHMEEVQLKQLMGEGCVIDITDQTSRDPSYGASVEDIKKWEEENGRLADDAIVIIRTGWEKYWPHANNFLGTRNIRDKNTFVYPGISVAAAEWLVANRKPLAVGVDTISFDATSNKPKFGAHLAILNNGVLGIENLANLGPLPARGSTVFLAAMKIDHGSGAPIRAFALGWEGEGDPCRRGAVGLAPCFIVIFMGLLLIVNFI